MPSLFGREFGLRSGAALGAGLLAATISISSAAAQNAPSTTAPSETVDTIFCQNDKDYLPEHNWTPETADLDCAINAVSDYAESTPGVGILIHVGQDLHNHPNITPDMLGAKFVELFNEQGVQAQYFLSWNDAPATGMNFHIGRLVYGMETDSQDMGIQQAINAIPETTSLLRTYWSDQLVQQHLDAAPPAPQPGD